MTKNTNNRRKSQQKQRTTKQHGSVGKRLHNRRWQRIRRFVLLEQPLCRTCTARGVVRASTEVDHIKPLHQGGTDDRENLQGLCSDCHDAKTRQEQGHKPKRVIGLDGVPIGSWGVGDPNP